MGGWQMSSHCDMMLPSHAGSTWKRWTPEQTLLVGKKQQCSLGGGGCAKMDNPSTLLKGVEGISTAVMTGGGTGHTWLKCIKRFWTPLEQVIQVDSARMPRVGRVWGGGRGGYAHPCLPNNQEFKLIDPLEQVSGSQDKSGPSTGSVWVWKCKPKFLP